MKRSDCPPLARPKSELRDRGKAADRNLLNIGRLWAFCKVYHTRVNTDDSEDHIRRSSDSDIKWSEESRSPPTAPSAVWLGEGDAVLLQISLPVRDDFRNFDMKTLRLIISPFTVERLSRITNKLNWKQFTAAHLKWPNLENSRNSVSRSVRLLGPQGRWWNSHNS